MEISSAVCVSGNRLSPEPARRSFEFSNSFTLATTLAMAMVAL